MQENSYWPLNGPSFFDSLKNPLTLGSPLIGLAKRLGFGHKFCGTDGKPTIRTLASPKPMEIRNLPGNFRSIGSFSGGRKHLMFLRLFPRKQEYRTGSDVNEVVGITCH
jgi:hypothetical protein